MCLTLLERVAHVLVILLRLLWEKIKRNMAGASKEDRRIFEDALASATRTASTFTSGPTICMRSWQRLPCANFTNYDKTHVGETKASMDELRALRQSCNTE